MLFLMGHCTAMDFSNRWANGCARSRGCTKTDCEPIIMNWPLLLPLLLVYNKSWLHVGQVVLFVPSQDDRHCLQKQ